VAPAADRRSQRQKVISAMALRLSLVDSEYRRTPISLLNREVPRETSLFPRSHLFSSVVIFQPGYRSSSWRA
jgi:hypothetical protein